MENKQLIVILVFLFLIILGTSLYLTNSREKEIVVNWVYDYELGLNKAKIEDKRILLDFYSDWCSWCTILDQDTYSNFEVASFLNDNFVCIKIDVEENISLAETYKIYGLPSVVLLSNVGEETKRIEGYKPPEQFLELIR